MATPTVNTPITGNKYALSAGTGASNAMETVVCLTNSVFTMDVGQIDTTSKCDGDYGSSIPGRITWTMTGDGQAIPGTAVSGTASFNKLAASAKSKGTLPVLFTNINDATDLIRGNAIITSISKTAGNNDSVVTFSITFTGVGEPFFTPAA